MSIPAMTFRVEDLLDGDRIVNGPLVVYWGQDREELYKGRPWTWPEKRPQRTFRARAGRWPLFQIQIRIQPREGDDLKEFGQDISRILGVPWHGEPKDGDRAIWLPAQVYAKDAGNALASACLVFKKLGGLEATAVQVNVERSGLSGGEGKP